MSSTCADCKGSGEVGGFVRGLCNGTGKRSTSVTTVGGIIAFWRCGQLGQAVHSRKGIRADRSLSLRCAAGVSSLVTI
ncbi:hypothetical protein VTK26DRAFT_725 [Humicola hyalothermophila]